MSLPDLSHLPIHIHTSNAHACIYVRLHRQSPTLSPLSHLFFRKQTITVGVRVTHLGTDTTTSNAA